MSPGMPEMILEIALPLEMAEKRRDPHVCETGDDHNDRQKPLQPQWTQGRDVSHMLTQQGSCSIPVVVQDCGLQDGHTETSLLSWSDSNFLTIK